MKNEIIDALKNRNYITSTDDSQGIADSIGIKSVQSDWNESDTDSPAYIKNKPEISEPYTLPTASAETLGGVKVGLGLSIADGVLSVNGDGSTPLIVEGHILNVSGTPTIQLFDGYSKQDVRTALMEGRVVKLKDSDSIFTLDGRGFEDPDGGYAYCFQFSSDYTVYPVFLPSLSM